jgi:hypothetical protein
VAQFGAILVACLQFGGNQLEHPSRTASARSSAPEDAAAATCVIGPTHDYNNRSGAVAGVLRRCGIDRAWNLTGGLALGESCSFEDLDAGSAI